MVRYENVWATPIGRGSIAVDPRLYKDLVAASAEFNANRHEAIRRSHETTGLVRFKRRNLLDSGIESLNEFTDIAVGIVRDYLRTAVREPLADEADLLVRAVVKTYEPGTRILPHYDAECEYVLLYYLTDCVGDNTRQTAEHLGQSGVVFVDPRGYRTIESAMQSTILYIAPKAGDFVIYPAYVLHESDPNLTGAERHILALSFTVQRPNEVPRRVYKGIGKGASS